MTDDTTANTVPALDDDALREFIRDMIADKIFTWHHIREHDQQLLGNIFIPITFGAFAEWSKDELEEIGAVWEYWSKAGPRGRSMATRCSSPCGC
jgi:hypothetical protein